MWRCFLKPYIHKPKIGQNQSFQQEQADFQPMCLIYRSQSPDWLLSNGHAGKPSFDQHWQPMADQYVLAEGQPPCQHTIAQRGRIATPK